MVTSEVGQPCYQASAAHCNFNNFVSAQLQPADMSLKVQAAVMFSMICFLPLIDPCRCSTLKRRAQATSVAP